jgi:hypothetical protein
MVRLTLIARTRDGLPLAEGLDADKEHEMYAYKSQAKVGTLTYPVGQGHCRRRPHPSRSCSIELLDCCAPCCAGHPEKAGS